MPSKSKRTFYQRFAVHAVGQGLFYSGRIEVGSDAFKFAFDCGSYHADAILREIDTFEIEMLKGSEELDLLVISHFDEDHVNHISDLLLKVKKVKRLVIPFLDFEERLYLLMRIYERRTGRGSRGPAGVSPEIARLILDPIGYLSNYLDGDSEVYLIEHGEGPVGPMDDNLNFSDTDRETQFRGENKDVKGRKGFSFDINPKVILSSIDFKTMKMTEAGATTFKVLDTSGGAMRIRDELLMEFIFYKRPLDHSEDHFYKLVAEEFKKVYKISDLELDTVLKKVKEIKSATKLKKIFSDAAKKCELPVTETANLNTTALSMLHRNLRGIVKSIFGGKHEQALNGYFHYLYERVETRHHFEGHDLVYKQYHGYPVTWPRYFVYPNTLLTSDSFIKKISDRSKFLDKFEPYLSEIWLMQIPHHGSEKNMTSDFINDSDYQKFINFFINYGIQNHSGHPDKVVLEWLQKGEQDRKLHLVNEWQGLAFELKLEV